MADLPAPMAPVVKPPPPYLSVKDVCHGRSVVDECVEWQVVTVRQVCGGLGANLASLRGT